MLLLISTIMLIVYTLFFSFFVRSKSASINKVTGKCISMALGMISGTMFGLFIALFLPQNLALSTIISIIVGATAAIIIAYPFGINGIIEGISSSLMGSMMGAMLGDMLNPDNIILMIIAMDLIYLLCIFSFIFLVNKETLKKQRPLPFIFSFVVSVSLLGLSLIVEIPTQSPQEMPNIQHEHHH